MGQTAGLSKKWALNNTLKGWTLFDLSTREAQIVVKTLSANEKKLTQVCQEHDLQWVSLNEETHADLFTAPDCIQNPYPALVVSMNSHEDTDYFVVRPKRVIHPRLHTRYEVAIPCKIIASNKEYSTETIDLSEGGLYFKDTIPDWVAGYFLVTVQVEGTSFQLMCSLVEDQKERKRVQVVSEESDPHYTAYKTWLAEKNN